MSRVAPFRLTRPACRASLFIAAFVVFCLAYSAGAFAQDAQKLTLHPSGFGAHSYAAWKAQQGEPDSTGNANQALYFQKMTTTMTFAAGVAVIKGIAGAPASELTGLAWDHREDGHCGAGAPRWNVALQDSSGNPYTIFFLGCNAAQHAEKGNGWCRDTQPAPTFTSLSNAIENGTGQPIGNLTITGLSILFDEGNDTPNPPPAGCMQNGTAGGFVYLDNIQVDFNGASYCWTSASDNSNNNPGPCPGPDSAPALSADTSPLVLSPLLPVAVDPSDLDLENGLNLVYPDVPITSWSLYPYVY